VITSYEVLWDSSTGGQVWTELVGLTVPLATPYYMATGLTMGSRYRFKVRA
jgi:Fibronectin type III domain